MDLRKTGTSAIRAAIAPRAILLRHQSPNIADTSMSNLLAFPDLKAKGIPFTRQHLHRLIKRGRFPPPLKLGVGTNRWLENEIDQWLAERALERTPRLSAGYPGGPT